MCCQEKILNIYNNLARKYGNVTVTDFRKYGNLEYKKKKLNLDIFLNNCKQLGVYPKFLIFKLLNVSIKDPSLIRKWLLHSAINNRNKELQHVLIIGIFDCLNYTLRLLHLITHLVNIFYNNYVINICPGQLLWFI